MSAPPKQYVDGILVQYGERLFWPPNRVLNRYGGGSRLPLHVAAALARRRPSKPVTAAAVRQQIRATIRRTPQVMVKVTGGGRGMSHIHAHLQYISRNGQLELENERGEKIQGKAALRELRDDWKYGGSEIPERSPRREAFNIVFSMPRTVDARDVRGAVDEVLKREFSNHAYVAVLHEPGIDPKTDRPHVHVAVRAEDNDGNRMWPRKADLQRWREEFAEALRERGVEALATRRESRGETRRAYPGWQAHTQRRKPEREVTTFEIERQREALGAWREIGMALAKSPDPPDREMAVGITQYLAETPAVQLLAANGERVRVVDAKLFERRRGSGGRER